MWRRCSPRSWGAAFVIVAQLPNLGGRDEDGGFWGDWLTRVLGGQPLSPFLTWPAEAVLGKPLPLVAVSAVSVAVFAAMSIWVGRRFAADAASAYGAATSRPRRAGRVKAPGFRTGAFRATMVKEGRLLRRDPGLIAQILLRIFYIVPLTFFIVQSGDELGAAAPLAAGAIALLAGQLAGSIAWIAISAEDAPGLLAASPVPIGRFWTAKLVLTLVPPAILVIPTAVALIVFAPLSGVLALLGGAASAVSAGRVPAVLERDLLGLDPGTHRQRVLGGGDGHGGGWPSHRADPVRHRARGPRARLPAGAGDPRAAHRGRGVAPAEPATSNRMCLAERGSHH